MVRTYQIALCSALLSVAMVGAACNKSDAPAPSPAVAPTATPAGNAGAPVPAAPPSPAAEAAAGSNTPLQNEGLAMMSKLADVFAADAKDCDKLATDIRSFSGQNKELMTKLSAMEKGLSEQDNAAFEQRNKATMDDVMKKMTPAMTGCRDNKNVEAAMKELPTD